VIKHLELLSRWKEFWNYIGGTTDPRPIYEKLAASYSEPHRAYHNLTHLHECLVALDASAVEPASARIVEVALWFHDSVYDPKAGDNEEQSAELAVRILRDASVPGRTIDEVRRLVLATKFHELDGSPSQSLMLDVDLSTLGSDLSRFSEYERQIRQEYSWAPMEVFGPKRTEILENFLKRPRLFQLPWFYNRLELRARNNLKESIALLKSQYP
jgi:predicted metal-dependent HD superfamily phosphohydrolase